MFRRTLVFVLIPFCGVFSSAQESAPAQQKPQVKVNVLNVCTPPPEDQREIASALSRIPRRPAFSQDFEVDRGRSVIDPNASPLTPNASPKPGAETIVADFVRMRHELEGSGQYSTVQYSFSRDKEQMIETLVFRVRDPKDLLQVSIDDSASSVTAAAAMLDAATPASRVRLERFGKPSVVLARCSSAAGGPAPDQSAYEPLFSSASSILLDYRNLLGVKRLVPEELTRISSSRNPVERRRSAPGKR